MTFELLIEGIQNPYSSKPAGGVTIMTFYEDDMVDSGTKAESFTPVSGDITGEPIVITNPLTSGIDSVYTLVFKADSSIPKNGFIHVYMPERVGLRPSEVLSDGACTTETLTCTDVKKDENLIVIKT